MTLAKALLAAGKHDTVLEVLESSGGLWESGENGLEAWIRSIHDGQDPWDVPR